MQHTFNLKSKGFSLSELLICLAILGVIAAFTIPKILGGSQNEKMKAIVKEDISAISAAYDVYLLRNVPTASTTNDTLTSYINYLKVDNTTVVDDNPGNTTQGDTVTCGSGMHRCLRMANGSILYWYSGNYFSGTSSIHGIVFGVDPDGKAGGTYEMVQFLLYYDGSLRSFSTMKSGTVSSGALFTTGVFGTDPTYFTWN